MVKKKEYYKVELEKHGGCKDCERKCKFNGLVATSETASLTEKNLFDCNSKKRS